MASGCGTCKMVEAAWRAAAVFLLLTVNAYGAMGRSNIGEKHWEATACLC